MGEWYPALTSREWALVSWITVALAAILARPSLRRSFGHLLKSVFQPLFLACFGAAVAYISACVWLLHHYEIWKIDNLKTTIVWAVTVAFAAMFRLNRLHDPSFYRHMVREALSLTALVIFVTEFYAFPFLVEFLLVPILVFFTLMSETSKGDPRHRAVEGFSGCALGLIAATYVFYSIYRTFTEPASLFTLDNGRDLIAPAALTVLFLPFLYAFGIWARYNDIFSVLLVWLPDRGLRCYAKWQAMLRFGTDVKTLDRWRHIVITSKPTTRAGIMQAVVEAWSMKTRDLSPLKIAPENGWEPINASQILTEFQLGTMDYKPVGDGEWSASSPYFEFGPNSAIWRNNVAYYVSGTQFAATELTLKLNLNVPDDALPAEEHFMVIALSLIEMAIDSEAVELVKMDLAAMNPFHREISNTRVMLTRDSWEGGAIKGGYEWTLRLTRGGQ